jgi:hypothetical protein
MRPAAALLLVFVAGCGGPSADDERRAQAEARVAELRASIRAACDRKVAALEHVDFVGPGRARVGARLDLLFTRALKLDGSARTRDQDEELAAILEEIKPLQASVDAGTTAERKGASAVKAEVDRENALIRRQERELAVAEQERAALTPPAR